MGHHRKRRRHNENIDYNQGSNNLDLNNIDFNQIGNMLSNGNSNGLSAMLNGVNNEQLSALLNNIDINQLAGLLNNIDLGQLSSAFSAVNSGGNSDENSSRRGHDSQQHGRSQSNDRRIELLNALKPIVNQERAQFIDTVIQLYAIAQIMKKK